MFKLKHFEISTSFRTTFPWSIHPCIYPHFSVFKGEDERLLNERTSLARSLVNSSFALNPKTENVHGIYTFFSLPLPLSLSVQSHGLFLRRICTHSFSKDHVFKHVFDSGILLALGIRCCCFLPSKTSFSGSITERDLGTKEGRRCSLEACSLMMIEKPA